MWIRDLKIEKELNDSIAKWKRKKELDLIEKRERKTQRCDSCHQLLPMFVQPLPFDLSPDKSRLIRISKASILLKKTVNRIMRAVRRGKFPYYQEKRGSYYYLDSADFEEISKLK